MCKDSAIVVGPMRDECEITMTTDSKLVVFCHQLVIRNSSNLEIMLCSPEPPILEGCSNITFGPMLYTHPDLLFLMYEAGNMSPWNNSWDEVIDLTPDLLCDGSPDGGQNWFI